MNNKFVGASARLFTNALTLILSAFAAWGWFAEVGAWPPRFSDCGVLAMAAVTLTAQQIANAMAAHTYYAFRRNAWASAIAGAALSLIFAGVTAFGVDHAFTTAHAMMRAEAAAEIASELTAASRDARAANARLISLPTDIPASRLVALQAPLQAALDAAEAREADARARYAAAMAPSAHEAPFRRLFELLSFCEVALYWVLAASQSQSQAPSLSQSLSQLREGQPQARVSRRPTFHEGLLRGVLGGAALAWSPLAPGAARPAPLPHATPISVHATPPPARARVASTVSQPKPAAAPSVPRARSGAGGTRPSTSRETPDWLVMAQHLRAAGLSFRAIAARVGVPKSTVWRRLELH